MVNRFMGYGHQPLLELSAALVASMSSSAAATFTSQAVAGGTGRVGDVCGGELLSRLRWVDAERAWVLTD